MPPHRNHTEHFLQLQVQERVFQSNSASLLKELENYQTLDSSKESQCTSNPGSSPIVPASAEDDTQTAIPRVVPDQLPTLGNESANPIIPKSSPQLNLRSPQNSDAGVIPTAMNALLDTDDSDISQEVMVYESEGDSGVSPHSRSLTFAQPIPPYKTPPTCSFDMNRSYSLPPRNFHSQMWHGAGKYRSYSYSDYVSEM